DVDFLQQNLDIIDACCSDNYLYLNIEKCCFASYTRKTNYLLSNYSIRGLQLMRVNTFKDLGVVFDSELSLQAHIDSLISSASKSLGFIMRTSRFFLSIDLLRTLYFAFVLYHLVTLLVLPELLVEKVQ